MLAVVKEHEGPGFAVKEVPYPVLRDTDVIIKVRSVGICGTDGPILAGTRPVPYPLIPGHEFAGDIVEVGSAVQHLKVGDRVTPCIVIGCGDCDMCIEGKEVLCDNLVETGIHVDGAFAEYVRVPAKVCRKMRDTTTYDQGPPSIPWPPLTGRSRPPGSPPRMSAVSMAPAPSDFTPSS
ncbi:MAG: zinc-dependent alcohol dehydrogenase [Evtepia gabavorous]